MSSSASKSRRSPSQTKEPSVSKTPLTQSIRDMIFKNGSGAKSPMSPSRISRLQEKEEMQNLNDRLVIYIDTVRRLEADNNRLQSIVNVYNENSTRDITEIKSLYERELEDAKRLIDDLAKEKAKFEIDMNKYKADAEEAISKLAKRDKEAKKLENDLKSSQSEAQEFKARYESLQTESGRISDELAVLKPHAADLEKQMAKLKKQLEEETLLRVDLENKNQTLKEDLQFKTQLYDKEIDQVRSSKRVELEQVDDRLRDEYDSRLVSELQRIRDETEAKMEDMRENFERRLRAKQDELSMNMRRDSQFNTSIKEELVSSQSKIDELNADIKALQTKVASGEAKVRELEEKLRRANAKYETDITNKDTELLALRNEIQDLLLEYQELYDIKIALDMEIGAYRKLLESEESRLNLTAPQQSLSYLGEPGARSAKKRRLQQSGDQEEQVVASSNRGSLCPTYKQTHTSTSGILIEEHDFEGKHVKLTNPGEKDLAIGGWQLKRVADDNETDFKFHKSTVLKPGQTITVWSSNCGVKHEPPSDIVMNSQRWFTGDKMITVLLDKESTEQAKRESLKSMEKKLRAAPNGSPSVASQAVQKLFSIWKN